MALAFPRGRAVGALATMPDLLALVAKADRLLAAMIEGRAGAEAAAELAAVLYRLEALALAALGH